MLYIKSNEEKKLVFEIDIHGCNREDLQGFVRFEIYGSEYGFPVEIDDRKITAVIPPLKKVVEHDIEDGTIVEARLDLVTEVHYFMPWSGEVKIGAPMGIKAELKGEQKGPSVKTKLVHREEKESTTEKVVEEDKAVTKEDIQSMIFDTLKTLLGKKKGALTETITEEKALAPPKKKGVADGWTKEKLLNITEDQIIQYMERRGTKTKMIQEVILNKARAAAGSDDNFKIFKEVVKALKKPK